MHSIVMDLSSSSLQALLTGRLLYILVEKCNLFWSFPSAGSRGAPEWARVWLCCGLPTTWCNGMDAGGCTFSRSLQICLQKWEHPTFLALPCEGWGLQQRGGRAVRTCDHYLLCWGGCASSRVTPYMMHEACPLHWITIKQAYRAVYLQKSLTRYIFCRARPSAD